jgi:hypothetical protein
MAYPWIIEIIRTSPLTGRVEFREGLNSSSFEFEVGMDLSCGIAAPPGKEWDVRHPWLSGGRAEVLAAIGHEFLKREFPSHKLRITDLFLWIIP